MENEDDEFLIWMCRTPDGEESIIITEVPDIGPFPLFGDEEAVSGSYAELARGAAQRAGGVAFLARYRRVPHA